MLHTVLHAFVVLTLCLALPATAQWSAFTWAMQGPVALDGSPANRRDCGTMGVPQNDNGIYEWASSTHQDCRNPVVKYVGVVNRVAYNAKLRQRCNEYNRPNNVGAHKTDKFVEEIADGKFMCFRWRVYNDVVTAGSKPGAAEETRLLALVDFPWNVQAPLAAALAPARAPAQGYAYPGGFSPWLRMFEIADAGRRTCEQVGIPDTADGSGVYMWGTSAKGDCSDVQIQYLGKADRAGGLRARCNEYNPPNGGAPGSHLSARFSTALTTNALCYKFKVMGKYVPRVTVACQQEPIQLQARRSEGLTLWNAPGMRVPKECQEDEN